MSWPHLFPTSPHHNQHAIRGWGNLSKVCIHTTTKNNNKIYLSSDTCILLPRHSSYDFLSLGRIYSTSFPWSRNRYAFTWLQLHFSHCSTNNIYIYINISFTSQTWVTHFTRGRGRRYSGLLQTNNNNNWKSYKNDLCRTKKNINRHAFTFCEIAANYDHHYSSSSVYKNKW